MTKEDIELKIEQLRHEIAGEEAFIKRQQDKKDRMQADNLGVRSGGISGDLASFDMSIQRAEARISKQQSELERWKAKRNG